MGLLSIIRKIKKKEKEMRILMVGLDNSGKTTIVLKINGEDTSVISPTLGFNIKTIAYQKYTLNIWDVGGQKTIRSYWRNYFEQTDGLVWVVDSSDLRRLDDCKMELDNLLKEERLSGASLLILANKQDIKGALAPEEIAKNSGQQAATALLLRCDCASMTLLFAAAMTATVYSTLHANSVAVMGSAATLHHYSALLTT
ncbi:unnamed protein product [Vicia faba]|uniref:ADP-ribosylation factor-like protein 2 n=1 Tax=Vicia faba TaxID=3906 RepID=A0AAV1AKV6_VICFA|nr:unnamed protein product [Vicia faba]